jgi:dTDP-4-dehydrorhamnose reductase
MNKKVMIIGSSGPVSQGLASAYGSDAVRVGRGVNAEKLFDLEKTIAHEIVGKIQPRVVVFLSAISGFAICERDPLRAYCLNVKKSAEVINCLNHMDIPVILVSSSAVFAKESPEKYETSPADPESTYGKSKRLLERHILASNNSLNSILRLTKVCSKELEIIRRWRLSYINSAPLVARAHHYVAPLPVSTVVEKLMYMIEQKTKGIVHLTSDEGISYLELARALFSEALVSAESVCGERLVKSDSVVLGASRSESTAVSLAKCLSLIRKDVHEMI